MSGELTEAEKKQLAKSFKKSHAKLPHHEEGVKNELHAEGIRNEKAQTKVDGPGAAKPSNKEAGLIERVEQGYKSAVKDSKNLLMNKPR